MEKLQESVDLSIKERLEKLSDINSRIKKWEEFEANLTNEIPPFLNVDVLRKEIQQSEVSDEDYGFSEAAKRFHENLKDMKNSIEKTQNEIIACKEEQKLQAQKIVQFENQSKFVNKFLQNAGKKIDRNLEFINKEKKQLANSQKSLGIEN